MVTSSLSFLFFFFNDTATTEIYTLSLHDALPICHCCFPTVSSPLSNASGFFAAVTATLCLRALKLRLLQATLRSEEHTSELQSQSNLVCRLLLEKKKKERK